MDPRYPVAREELYNVQMDIQKLHHVQGNHAERLSRLEKRQADDAAIKSAWNSPFPSALGGTPQHGPLQMPPNEMFDEFEEHGQNLLGSLHLDADDEPARRGAASRANSVRFDESALQGSSWTQNGRHSGDFGPIRPGSGLGTTMERSLSHKSDGRHSSAGHSVHSVHSLHSAASGRGSSLGLDTNFANTGTTTDDDSPVDVPEPPPGFFILGSVPSIVRCWLIPTFAHDTLLYADICTGSQKSVLDFSLIKELDLVEEVHRELDGVHRIRLSVYLTEATVAHSRSRGASPAPQIPSIMSTFEVTGMDQPDSAELKKGIRIFIGSETLREHSADVLFSQNRMTLYSSEREKLSVPFVRPEDNGMFRNIRTLAILPEKPKLNATARPFVFGEAKQQASTHATSNGTDKAAQETGETQELLSPTSDVPPKPTGNEFTDTSENSVESDKSQGEKAGSDGGTHEQREASDKTPEDGRRRESAASGIWSSWRQGSSANGSDQKESTPLSGYQPAGRGRSMKVLKPSKSISSSARTGAAYEPAPSSRSSGEQRRKSQAAAGESAPSGSLRWKSERSATVGAESAKILPAPVASREPRSNASTTSRTSSNPVGGASAFSWMNPSAKPKTPTATAE